MSGFHEDVDHGRRQHIHVVGRRLQHHCKNKGRGKCPPHWRVWRNRLIPNPCIQVERINKITNIDLFFHPQPSPAQVANWSGELYSLLVSTVKVQHLHIVNFHNFNFYLYLSLFYVSCKSISKSLKCCTNRMVYSRPLEKVIFRKIRLGIAPNFSSLITKPLISTFRFFTFLVTVNLNLSTNKTISLNFYPVCSYP